MAARSFAEEEETMRGLSHCVLPVKRLWKNHAWVLGSHWQSQPSSSPEGGGSWGSGGPSWPDSSVALLAELSSISPSSSSSSSSSSCRGSWRPLRLGRDWLARRPGRRVPRRPARWPGGLAIWTWSLPRLCALVTTEHSWLWGEGRTVYPAWESVFYNGEHPGERAFVMIRLWT